MNSKNWCQVCGEDAVHLRAQLQLATDANAVLQGQLANLEAEKETWGNEFSAVIIVKDQLAQAQKDLNDLHDAAEGRVSTLRIMLDIVMKALQWYANEQNYVLNENHGMGDEGPITHDNGLLAREALARLNSATVHVGCEGEVKGDAEYKASDARRPDTSASLPSIYGYGVVSAAKEWRHKMPMTPTEDHVAERAFIAGAQWLSDKAYAEKGCDDDRS